MRPLLLCAALCSILACRTEIKPVVRAKRAPVVLKAPEPGECEVRDYPNATDLPATAKNVAWVKVPREKDDETTFEKLREAVCAAGGNAFSQARWIRAPGASVADAPVELEANAWLQP